MKSSRRLAALLAVGVVRLSAQRQGEPLVHMRERWLARTNEAIG